MEHDYKWSGSRMQLSSLADEGPDVIIPTNPATSLPLVPLLLNHPPPQPHRIRTSHNPHSLHVALHRKSGARTHTSPCGGASRKERGGVLGGGRMMGTGGIMGSGRGGVAVVVGIRTRTVRMGRHSLGLGLGDGKEELKGDRDGDGGRYGGDERRIDHRYARLLHRTGCSSTRSGATSTSVAASAAAASSPSTATSTPRVSSDKTAINTKKAATSALASNARARASSPPPPLPCFPPTSAPAPAADKTQSSHRDTIQPQAHTHMLQSLEREIRDLGERVDMFAREWEERGSVVGDCGGGCGVRGSGSAPGSRVLDLWQTRTRKGTGGPEDDGREGYGDPHSRPHVGIGRSDNSDVSFGSAVLREEVEGMHRRGGSVVQDLVQDQDQGQKRETSERDVKVGVGDVKVKLDAAEEWEGLACLSGKCSQFEEEEEEGREEEEELERLISPLGTPPPGEVQENALNNANTSSLSSSSSSDIAIAIAISTSVSGDAGSVSLPPSAPPPALFPVPALVPVHVPDVPNLMNDNDNENGDRDGEMSMELATPLMPTSVVSMSVHDSWSRFCGPRFLRLIFDWAAIEKLGPVACRDVASLEDPAATAR
ncbi:hypothetical protein CVT25_008365 [Psilocybe cyanescens]|uniref:Uncharacterized protein n=1 Tax=Psilocybe cyanescens TaxID=93625 RepID=A0A409WV58_PSICY|nr:hypothetical protein CVT25_008365 [Psilocybe cyanescens]